MRIIKTPWVDELKELVENTKKNIKIICPVIKEKIYNQILNNKQNQVKIELITTFKFSNFCSTQTDLTVINSITESGGKVKFNSNLNANILIFDDKKAIIFSSNFSEFEIMNPYEYGVLIDDKVMMLEVLADYNSLAKDEHTRVIKKTEIGIIESIITNVYKLYNYKKTKYSKSEIECIRNTKDVVEMPMEAVNSVFEGWQLEVFSCINLTQHQIFTLDDINLFDNHLRKLFPTQKNIPDKIKVQLDYFVGLGLITALENGVYKKLWK